MENTKNCIKCGAQIPMDAMICPVCGANQQVEPTQQEQTQVQQPVVEQQPNQNQGNVQTGEKEKTTALILCILPYIVQIHGLHRFYTGHIGIGIIQLLTWGGCGIWTLIDLIQIISGNFKDAEGRPLKG